MWCLPLLLRSTQLIFSFIFSLPRGSIRPPGARLTTPRDALNLACLPDEASPSSRSTSTGVAAARPAANFTRRYQVFSCQMQYGAVGMEAKEIRPGESTAQFFFFQWLDRELKERLQLFVFFFSPFLIQENWHCVMRYFWMIAH